MAKSVKKAKTDGKGTHDYAFYEQRVGCDKLINLIT